MKPDIFNKIREMQSRSFMNYPRQLSFSFYSVVAKEPALWFLYQPYIWWTQMKRVAAGYDPQASVVTRDTELVIDGFQGSANSFAVAAFNQCQTQAVNLAHHLHSPAQIIKAIRYDIPVLLTVREPEATVLSLTSRWPHLNITQSIRGYIGFYSKLKPYHSGYIISTFEQTTQYLDQMIQEINNQFNTNFDLVNIEQVNAEHNPQINSKQNHEIIAQRKRVKLEKKQEINSKANKDLLSQAEEIYQCYVEFAKS
jgi:hypothetical protein